MDSKTKLRVVNGLTLARFPLVLLFFVGALVNSWVRMDWLFWSSLAVLILAAMTDLFDGRQARSRLASEWLHPNVERHIRSDGLYGCGD